MMQAGRTLFKAAHFRIVERLCGHPDRDCIPQQTSETTLAERSKGTLQLPATATETEAQRQSVFQSLSLRCLTMVVATLL